MRTEGAKSDGLEPAPIEASVALLEPDQIAFGRIFPGECLQEGDAAA